MIEGALVLPKEAGGRPQTVVSGAQLTVTWLGSRESKNPSSTVEPEGSFVVIGPARAQRERTGLWRSPGAGLLRYWQ